MIRRKVLAVKSILVAVVILAFAPVRSGWAVEDSQDAAFQQGCCLNRHAFPRPAKVSTATVPRNVLLEALNCAATNKLKDTTPAELAESLGNRNSLLVAYYYGAYLPEASGPELTIVAYATDGKSAVLFDIAWERDDYYVGNQIELRRGAHQWRVGEIFGGIWSYTRLWYLAQEIGSRPRQRIPSRAVAEHKPASCDAGPPY